MTLQMTDKSLAQPEGIPEDVLIKVGKFIFPMDFMVIVIEEDVPTATRKAFPCYRSIFDRCEEMRAYSKGWRRASALQSQSQFETARI